MNITVLGTTASLPTKNGLPSCVAVKHGGNYLLDCCEAAQVQCAKYGVSPMKIDAIFITHLHADHFLGLFGLLQSLGLMGRTRPLLIVTPKGGKAFFESIFALKPLATKFPVEFKEAGSRTVNVYKNDLFKVTAFPTKHSTPSVGYRIQEPSYRRFDEDKARGLGVRGRLFGELQTKGSIKLNGKTLKFTDVSYVQEGRSVVYTGDTAACAGVSRNAKGATLLIHDSTFGDDEAAMAKEKKHSTARQAAKIAAKAKCKKLLLIHFSNRYEDDRGKLLTEAREEFPDSEAAIEGMELVV